MKRFFYIAVVALFLIPSVAFASGEKIHLPEVDLSYDEKTFGQGREVFETVCNNCHTMLLHKDPDTNAPYYVQGVETPEENKKKQLDLKESFGKVPPDLTLMAKAKKGGAPYIYAILAGFAEDKEKKCSSGNYNKYFDGHCIAMPPQSISDEEMKDVASFIWYTSEPTLLVREEVGWYVVPFAAFMTVILYLLKKKTWADIKKKK